MTQDSNTRPTIKVVHLLDSRHMGGVEQLVPRLSAEASRIDVAASIYCVGEGRANELIIEEGLPMRAFPSTGRFDFRALPAMARALREDGAQVIHAHSSRMHMFARWLSARLGIANITSIHSPIAQDDNRGFGRHPVRAMIERLGRRWTDFICPACDEEARRIISEERAPADKVIHVPNGMEPIEPARREVGAPREDSPLGNYLREQGLPPDAFVVAMIAALRPRKGPEIIISAFGRFIRDGGAGVLLVIGDDAFMKGLGYMDKLKALAIETGGGDSVSFAGFQTRPWLFAREADLIAFPSLYGEAQPLVCLEAMNHALPIAGSDSLGVRECVVDGRNGWLHAPGDDETLAKHLRQAADGPADLRRRGESGRAMFDEKFDMEQVLPHWREIYERAVANHR